MSPTNFFKVLPKCFKFGVKNAMNKNLNRQNQKTAT